MMPEALTEDDPEDDIAFDGRSIANACAACVLHLADLKEFELWPVSWILLVGPRELDLRCDLACPCPSEVLSRFLPLWLWVCG